MNSEIIKKIIAEWLGDKVFPPLIKRDAPDLVLERTSEIIAVAGPRRAGKTCYMYQLIQDLLAQGNWSREDILFVDFEDYRLTISKTTALRISPPLTRTLCWLPSTR